MPSILSDVRQAQNGWRSNDPNAARIPALTASTKSPCGRLHLSGGDSCLLAQLRCRYYCRDHHHRFNDMFRDPRAEFGDFLWTGIIAGAKGFRYLCSSQYRVRVQEYWRDHPTSRQRDIRMMIFWRRFGHGTVVASGGLLRRQVPSAVRRRTQFSKSLPCYTASTCRILAG